MLIEQQGAKQFDARPQPVQVLIWQKDPEDTEIILKLLATVDFAQFDLTMAHAPVEVEQRLLKTQFDVLLIDSKAIKENIRYTLEQLVEHYPLTSLMLVGDGALMKMEPELLKIGLEDCLDVNEITAKGLSRALRKAIEKKQILRQLHIERNLINSLVDAIKNGELDTDGEQDLPSQFHELVEATLLNQNAELLEKVQRQKQQLQQLAHKDRLTGLANRAMFEQVLRRDLAHAKRRQRRLVLLYIDIDQFSQINKQYGHLIADQVLQQVALRLTRVLRAEDFVARLTGDEFAVIINELPSTHHAALISRKIIDELSQAFTIDEGTIRLSTCIGISAFPNDGEKVSSLLKNADIALCSAKKLGNNMYQFSTEDLRVRHLQRLHLETDLTEAIASDQFYLVYQPIVSLAENKIIAVEALSRWQHPQFGKVMPAEFIELAERSGTIHELGHCVIKKAIQQCAQLRKDGFADIKMSINLSPMQFNDHHLVDYICELLRDNHLTMQDFEFEVKESTLISNGKNADKVLQHIAKLGGLTAIDNFGLGFNSIAELKAMPISTLKIDKKFIQHIGSRSENLAKIFISLAQQLGLKALVEGVETEEQLAFLKACQCDRAQGYFISKPLRSEKLLEYLRQN